MKSLYALLVGINDYQAPLAQLRGCRKDVAQIEGFLDKYMASSLDIHLKKLLDREATYTGIVTAFRNHLGQAGPGDVIWFHFSGHGSEEPTADDFLSIEPNGKDQNLICYPDPDGPSDYLADKELAVLLHQLEQKHTGEDRPHILVSLDCCHSGSGTRSAVSAPDIVTRNAPTQGIKRTLASYADGFYAQRQGQLQIPVASHLVLSACESVERAGDLPQGGAFTTGLVNALEQAKGMISYNDLYLQARASVRKILKTQTPKFATIGSFDPYTRFLDGSPMGSPILYEIQQKDDGWSIQCGAVHGLPTDASSPLDVEVYSPAPESKLLGRGQITSVGAQRSQIKLLDGFNFKHLLRSMMPGEENYLGKIISWPAEPVLVQLSGEVEGLERIRNVWRSDKNIHWTGDPVDSGLTITATTNHFTLRDDALQQVAMKSQGVEQEDAVEMIDAVSKLVNWRRSITLNNKKPTALKDMVRLEIIVHDTQRKEQVLTLPEVKLYANAENSMKGQFGFGARVKVKDAQQPLFCYLFHLRQNYSIQCYEGEVTFRPEEFPDQQEVTLPLWKKIYGWGPASDEAQTTSYFQLIVTTEPLDYQQLMQSGLRVVRDEFSLWNPTKLADDWYVSTIKVTITRQDNSIGAQDPVLLADGQLVIEAHPHMKGKVGLSSVSSGMRSQDPVQYFSQLNRPGFELQSLSQTRSSASQQVLEITDIPPGIQLDEEPLMIRWQSPIADNEMLLPIAFDGQHFTITGQGVPEGDGVNISITSLPLQYAPAEGEASPFSDQVQDRSLFSSLKLAFFKVVLKKEDSTYRLQWAKISDGKVTTSRENILNRVLQSKKILLLVHDLWGDGAGMLRDLHKVNHQSGTPIPEQFDLILLFDYESMATPIEETATHLKSVLDEMGFGPDDAYEVTVVAKGLGGLAVRWMIEKCDADGWLDQVLLLGTPHQGTPYGKLDRFRKIAGTIMDAVINFVPDAIPFLPNVLKLVRGVGEVSVTLGQMAPDTPFLNRLNSSSPPGARYHIFAGDVSHYELPQGGFSTFLKKKSAHLAFRGESHDLFSPVKSNQAEELWQLRRQEVNLLPVLRCQHLDYLTSSDGLSQLAQFPF
ncbi:MAG: caspase family protein [Saprospiraceae bacterium]